LRETVAGANIAAVLAIKARDRKRAALGQVLIYPPLISLIVLRAISNFSQGSFSMPATMDWYANHYLLKTPTVRIQMFTDVCRKLERVASHISRRPITTRYAMKVALMPASDCCGK